MSDQTLYLTFDDGPLGGTDDVIATLNETKVKGILFSYDSFVEESRVVG